MRLASGHLAAGIVLLILPRLGPNHTLEAVVAATHFVLLLPTWLILFPADAIGLQFPETFELIALTYLPASLVWGLVLDRTIDRVGSSAVLRSIVVIAIFLIVAFWLGMIITLMDASVIAPP